MSGFAYNLTLTVKPNGLEVLSGAYAKVHPTDTVPGFDLKIDKHRRPQRFYVMGESLVHETDNGMLRVVGPSMRLQLNQPFNTDDLSLIAPIEQAPITLDYVKLFAINLQTVLQTTQNKAKKEYEDKLQNINRELKKAKDATLELAEDHKEELAQKDAAIDLLQKENAGFRALIESMRA